MLSQTHAAKSEALRRMLGMGGNAVLQKLPTEGIMRRASSSVFASKPMITTDAPPGLGNWDNSCYQNSVLQGLASLDSLPQYLQRTIRAASDEDSTSGSLSETVAKLTSAGNNGKQLWTPAKLKSMSSWQQQDAQEYFSKIMDELEKEAIKFAAAPAPQSGLEAVAEERHEIPEGMRADTDVAASRIPMDGLLAQKVACTACGFSEGLSMIPFNCLTVPLGSDFAYDLDECLDEYTKLEEITDVECARCTLLRAEKQLTKMLPSPPTCESTADAPAVESKVLSLPPELRAQAFKRLAAIQSALENDDYEDKTLLEKCEIPKKQRVSSTKTRQAVVARPPKGLVIHVNRSVFDELTGVQRKNYANVRWPGVLDLGSWMLRASNNSDNGSVSLLAGTSSGDMDANYRVKAVVTHYGRHENGHYICYRRHPVRPQVDAIDTASVDDLDEQEQSNQKPRERWWRLSDEDVSSVSEEEVLAQGGVFMLFYERIEDVEQVTEQPLEKHPAEDKAMQPTVQPVDGGAPMLTDTDEPADDHTDDIEIDPSPIAATLSSPSISLGDETPDTRPSTATTTDTESEADFNNEPRAEAQLEVPQKAPSPPAMRTARGRQSSQSEKGGFGGMGMRAMAAT